MSEFSVVLPGGKVWIPQFVGEINQEKCIGCGRCFRVCGRDVFELIGLDIKMFYGGPSEALMHAVYRQNYGFSDLVIGSKHADAPYDDGSNVELQGVYDCSERSDTGFRSGNRFAISVVRMTQS